MIDHYISCESGPRDLIRKFGETCPIDVEMELVQTLSYLTRTARAQPVVIFVMCFIISHTKGDK